MSDHSPSTPSLARMTRTLVAYVLPCVALLFLLDTLYRLDSFVKAMGPYDLLVSVAAMFLIMLALGGAAVLAGLCVAVVVWPVRARLLDLVRWSALAFVVLVISVAAVQWMLKVSLPGGRLLGEWLASLREHDFPTSILRRLFYVLTVAVSLIYLAKKKRLDAISGKIERFGTGLVRAMPLLITGAVAIIGYHVLSGGEGRGLPVCATDLQHNIVSRERPMGRGPLPDIVLVTFDALTARDMSLYGYRLPTTPGLESLALDSDVYQGAIAVSNWTKPGTVSILTGQYPHHHGLVSALSDAVALGKPERTLPNLLRNLGYRASAVVSNEGYGHPFVNGTYRSFDVCPWDAFSPGFLDGNLFRRFRHLIRNEIGSALIAYDIHVVGWIDELVNYLAGFRFEQWGGGWGGQWNERSHAPPARTFDLARQLLEGGKAQPSFLWIHVFPPHWPYLPEPRYRGRFLTNDNLATARTQSQFGGAYDVRLQGDVDRLRLRYDEFILNADQTFADFVNFLKNSGRWENTLLVVSADHGESFEDGLHGHRGEYLYQQLIHIPLLVHFPGQREGARIGGAVSQVDIAPTILSYLRVPVPSWMDGKPLGTEGMPEAENLYRYAMEFEGNGRERPIKKGIVAATDGRYKLVYSLTRNTVELFDLLEDPDESRNVAAENRALVERMQTAVIENIVSE